MKTEHHPKGVRLNNLGANTSDEKIFVGASEKGFYNDSNNMRLGNIDGDEGDASKIRGEDILHDSGAEPGTWTCIGTEDVNDRKFEIWVEDTASQDPIIRIDGVKVAQSADMPFLKAFPFQIDKNEGCEEGEVFITDDNTTPLYFDIKDMLDNVATPKYFAGFNHELYTVNLEKPLDIPVFLGLENVGGSGGLPVGSYQYGIAYVTKSGDRTAISEKTPPIPIVRGLSEGSRVFPWIRTFGDSSNVSSKTSFGPKIRFRVNNTSNYDSIEIIRFDYNVGAGINFTPVARVVGRVDIEDGQIDYVDFIDPVDSDRIIVLSVEEELSESYLIDTAKGIRYYGTRVEMANIKLVDKIDTSVFNEINGDKIVPIVEGLNKSGHNDPYNHSYRSSDMGGEKSTIGIHYWDAVGGKTFVKEDSDLKNLQYPNRRDVISADSLALSYNGFPVAADIDGAISNVFESFDHANAESKGDKDNFKNILKKGSRLTTTVLENSFTPPDEFQASQGFTALTTKAPYLPFRPVNDNESAESHSYLPNVEVDENGFLGGGAKHNYDPECFALDYYGKGYALAGLSNIPDWVKSFSIVRTQSAGRVICQGLGMYNISPGSYSGTSADKNVKKDNGSMWFFSPDIDSGLVSQAEIDNIKQNPGDYKVQFVSPLGFFSETYSFESNSLKDHLVDMITYARVQRDNGEINPGVDPTTGPSGYVYYNKYRGVDSPLFDVNEGFFSGSDGNKEMPIEFFNEIKEGRGSYFDLGFLDNIYGVKNLGGATKRDFDDTGLKNWTEPFYMINIIKTGAQAPNADIQGYRSTGTHVKRDSIIGLGDGTDLTQEFELVDERWEDCCYNLTFPTVTDRYLFLRSLDTGDERIFYDATNASPALVATIQADILANGFWVSPNGNQVVGLYTHENTGTGVMRNHEFVIKFTFAGDFPTTSEYIIVKYDNRVPVRFFGGDTYVGETIFAPIDRQLKLDDNTDNPEDTEQFILNAGFPYGRYKMNPRYFRTKNTTAINKIQDSDWHSFSHMRQLCVMFNCDNRIAAHYAHNEAYPLQYFPLTHYVMRPNVWDETLTLKGNNLYDEYEDDYPGEFPERFEHGGIRFKQNYNVDYSSRGRVEFFSKPDIGFEENTKFCNLVAWSLPRATNQQDSPGLKTFLVANSIEIEDGQGEIKFLYSATYSDKGSNLYAVTERGVCLLMTEKSILSNISSDFLTSVASDQFIAKEFWIEREIGSHDEFWRGKSEGTTTIPGEIGDTELEFLIWPNKESVFTLINNEVRNVGNKQYRNTLLPFLSNHSIDTSRKLVGAFDQRRNEYYLEIENKAQVTQNFKFYMRNFQWVGRQEYRFDKYLFSNGRMYGMRDLETYLLDEGFIINGAVIEAWLIQIFAKEPYSDKEFIEVGVETGGRGAEKPTKIEFLEQDGTIIATMEEAIQGPNWLLRYDNWRQQIPRRPNDGDRIQDQLVIYKIFHNLAVDFKVVNTTIQFKVLI